MNTALYKKSNELYLLKATDITSRKEYLEKYVGNLYCPTPGCTAELDFVEVPNWREGKIFRTHKGSNHLPSCPHNIIHQESHITFSSKNFAQSISDEHIKSVLKGLYQRNINPLSVSTSAPKRSTSQHRSAHSLGSPLGRAVASLDPNAEPVEKGVREPSVRKRHCNDLLMEDNGKLRGVDGVINRATIGNDYIELHFSGTTSPVSMLFYNAFRDSNEQAYKLVLELAHMLNTSSRSILSCCLGVVEMNNKTATIQIMNPNLITFEGLSIFSYMSLMAS